MKIRLYPELPALRSRTMLLDGAVVLAVVLFAWLGVKVHDGVEELTSISDGVQQVGGSVQGAFRSAGDAAGKAPIVGGAVGDALRGAGRDTGGEAVRAGRQGEESIHSVASLLGWVTFLVPSLLLLSRAVPPRVAQARRLTAAEQVLHSPVDDERRALLAQRAAFGLPYATLLRHTTDPIGDLAAGRLEPLVDAVREDAGLRPRPAARPAGRAAS